MPNEATLAAERRFQKLELLLNGLAELGDVNEPLIDQAYTIALESVSSPEHLKILAEALRKKWLSEREFPPVAVRICKKLSNLSIDDIRFRSIIYSHVINDYRDRAQLRKISRTLFCNSAHFAFEFYRHFHVLEGGEEKLIRRQKSLQSRSTNQPFASRSSLLASRSTIKTQDAGNNSGDGASTSGGTSRKESGGSPFPHVSVLGEDDHLYVGFIDPMLEYLGMLIDDMATEHEMTLFHYLMFLMGPYLERRKQTKIQNIMMNVRRKVIDADLRASIRALLMELIEIHSHNWKPQQLTSAVTSMYLKYRPASYSLGVAMNEATDENNGDDFDDESN